MFSAHTSLENPYLPQAFGDEAVWPGSSQTVGYEYDFEARSQVPFNVGTSASPDINQVGQGMGYTSSFKPGNRDNMGEDQSANIVDGDAISPRSHHLISPWTPQTVNTTTDADQNTSAALKTTPPTKHVGPRGSISSSWVNAQPFLDATHPTAIAPLPLTMPPSKTPNKQLLKEDQVSRLEKVLEAVDEAGFESIDSMIAAYYTSVVPLESPVHSAQVLSRKRHLKRCLATLHDSSKEWDAQELQSFRDGIMSCAEDILIDEMLSLDLNSHVRDRTGKDTTIATLESIFASKESQALIKGNRKVFQQEVRSSPPRRSQGGKLRSWDPGANEVQTGT